MSDGTAGHTAEAEPTRRDHRGRYRHEWGVVGQCFEDGYVEIVQCQIHSCGIFEDSKGKRYKTLDALRAAFPILNHPDSDRDFWAEDER